MTDRVANSNRDEVLLAFHEHCEVPTAEDIFTWVNKHPEFADDIRAHAAILRDWAGAKELPERIPDEVDLTRANSRVLSALHNLGSDDAVSIETEAVRFEAMMEAKSTTIPALARILGLDRLVLAKMVNGLMRAPVGDRLVAAWTSYFEVSRSAFENAFTLAAATPRLGHANAQGPPKVSPQTYEEIVRGSTTMSSEQVQYWLGED